MGAGNAKEKERERKRERNARSENERVVNVDMVGAGGGSTRRPRLRRSLSAGAVAGPSCPALRSRAKSRQVPFLSFRSFVISSPCPIS